MPDGDRFDPAACLARAADARAREATAFDVRALVARGLRQRFRHRLSLAAAGAAAVAALVVAVVHVDPQAVRIPDGGFATEPPSSGSPSPAPSGSVPAASSSPSAVVAPSPEPSPSDGAPIPADERCVPAPAIRAPGGVEVELRLSETAVARGQPVDMTLRVTNASSREVRYEHSSQRYDFWLEDDQGAVWLWSAGLEFTQPLIVDRLGAGETRAGTERWSGETSACPRDGGSLGPGASGLGRPPPGRYVARALWLTIDGGWWSNAVEVVVI